MVRVMVKPVLGTLSTRFNVSLSQDTIDTPSNLGQSNVASSPTGRFLEDPKKPENPEEPCTDAKCTPHRH